MDPTLEESVRQYHPHKQNILMRQSTIYQPVYFNRDHIPFDPREANINYHKLRCGKTKEANKKTKK